MAKSRIAGLAVAALLAAGAVAAEAQDTPAKILFSRVQGPAPLAARSIGFYSRGCLAGGAALPVDGPEWQAMRLSRNRNWGMPVLVAYIETLAHDAKVIDGWPGLLVGDMSQPRGGPLPSGHTSHQIGLDVDIWLTPMPDHTLTADEREKIAATSYIKPGTHTELDRSRWTDAVGRLLKRAASYDGVERIFINPGIKKELCETAGRDRAWLRKIRPWYLHDDHLHVRLACPPGAAGCKAQDAVPAGDGCGANLDYWLSEAPYKPPPKPTKPVKPAPPLTLASLPAACRDVLSAGVDGGIEAVKAATVPLPPRRPEVN